MPAHQGLYILPEYPYRKLWHNRHNEEPATTQNHPGSSIYPVSTAIPTAQHIKRLIASDFMDPILASTHPNLFQQLCAQVNIMWQI